VFHVFYNQFRRDCARGLYRVFVLRKKWNMPIPFRSQLQMDAAHLEGAKA
jgi:hypothetical protein